MKTGKIFTGIAAAALVFSLEAVSAFGVEPGTAGNYTDNVAVCCYCGGGCQFVDEDGDGICDNYNGQGTYCQGAGCGFVDEDGDGVCDYYNGQGAYCQGIGQGYVDENGDGVCDNYQYRGCGRQGGRRGGRGCHRR